MMFPGEPPPWGDQFEIEEELGEGGFAKVFRARNTDTERVVALKALKATVNPDALVRMKREIEVLTKLDSPYIVPVYEADERCTWYSMQLASAHLEQRGPMLDRCEQAEAVLSVTKALKAAHDIKVIHRDISPRNILWFPEDRRWMLADFGNVRRFPGHTTSVITDDGGVWTYLFAAPEQEIDGHNVDHRCDIFSLGQVIGWLTSGRNPAPQMQTTHAPKPWRELVTRMTSRPKNERPESMDIVLTELERILDHLRDQNREAWETRNVQSTAGLAKRPDFDRATFSVLRYLFAEGPQPEWSLLFDAAKMGLSKEGVRVGLIKARSLGLISECLIEDREGDQPGLKVSPGGEDYVLANIREDQIIIQHSTATKSSQSDDPPF
jgi:serine/threonine protein kinase